MRGERGELVIVAGATGYVGRHVVAELTKRDYRVRALVRSPESAERSGAFGAPALSGPGVEVRVCDVTRPTGWEGACEGAAHVVSALGVTRQKADPWDVDFLGNLHVLRDAERAGVRGLVYVGVMGIEEGRSRIHRAKYAFTQALARSTVASAIVNPSGLFSDVSEFVDLAARGIVPAPAGTTRIQPIHGADLAAFCVDRLGERGSWDVGGPEVFTLREIADLAREATGGRARVLPVPRPVLGGALTVAKGIGGRAGLLAEFFGDNLARDLVGEATGTHHLREYFAELGRGAGAGRK